MLDLLFSTAPYSIGAPVSTPVAESLGCWGMSDASIRGNIMAFMASSWYNGHVQAGAVGLNGA
jgi:hypothetical protein